MDGERDDLPKYWVWKAVGHPLLYGPWVSKRSLECRVSLDDLYDSMKFIMYSVPTYYRQHSNIPTYYWQHSNVSICWNFFDGQLDMLEGFAPTGAFQHLAI